MKIKVFYFFALLFLTLINSTFAQRSSKSKTLQWTGIKSEKISEVEYLKMLSFDGAVYDYETKYLPVYFERFKIASRNSTVNVVLTNKVFKEFDNKTINQIKDLDLIKNDIVVKTSISIDRKIPYASFSFIPIRKNPLSGKYEKLISFKTQIKIIATKGKKDLVGFKIYAQNSVLSSGNWYKISTPNTGIHKISYNELQAMGINVSSINPKNIRIYGNGGGILPENNSEFRYDDLQENAIYVAGENDGSFDSGDYILFYAQGPNTWKYNSTTKKFNHYTNSYSDKAYYFINTEIGQGKRISTEQSSTLPANNVVDKFNARAFHEKDFLNLIKSGREWYGEKFDIIRTYNTQFAFPNIVPTSRVHLKVNVAARSVSSTNNTFSTVANGNTLISSVTSVGTSYNSDYAKSSSDTMGFTTSNSNIDVSITFNNTSSSAIGWLNYFELNAVRYLIMQENHMDFRDIASIGVGNITKFTLSNANPSVKIWDVTNHIEPKLIEATINGTILTFKIPTDSLREFVAHNGNYYYSTSFVEKVTNQNLHGLGQTDMIIVAHPDFVSQANRLANLHINNDGLSVVVVVPKQIYNEFSSGGQDITAIRDFVKMFYDRADTNQNDMPKYLLLFGDGSYDNKNRLNNNTNYIPTFQSTQSLHPAYSYVTDDYYGLLDDNEGGGANGNLDVGIGRFPVKNSEEAKEIVDKIERYTSNTKIQNTGCNNFTNAISNLGDWRNIICFIADDEDGNQHLYQANQLATMIDTSYKDYNVDKIYFDAYTQISTPGGQQYPEVKDAINKRVEKGALIINYTGHGGEIGWAHESVLEIPDINNWSNKNNMPVFVTATCEFSRFDDPARTSAGELVILNPNGGAIALFTTSRLSFSNSNFYINQRFYHNVFKKKNNEYYKLGDIIKNAKVESGSLTQNRNFVLLGDPALELAYPELNALTTKINNISVTNISVPDTLKALSKVEISGIIEDDNGIKKTNFNGTIYPTVFDKAATYTTKANDIASSKVNFKLQNNILYKGKASVINGDFTFSFVVPKDIAYQYGFGRISYYAENGVTDANGYFENIIIGGSSDNPIIDNSGPNIELYLNDEKFVFGGITDENPLLLSIVADSNGINTVGNGIGHDIIAILDENTEKSIVLNDYYEADLDSYKKGTIRYPFSDLSDGTHTLKLKVWDVLNNSSETSTEFVVAESAELALSHVLNYPNPFTTRTLFYFEHNHPCCDLDVQIQIFTISGRLIKTINTNVQTNGFRAEPIPWDGKDDYGDKIGIGVYIYRLRVKTQDDSYSEKMEKLVILK